MEPRVVVRTRPASPETQFTSRSYSYSSSAGENGEPIIRQSRRFSAGNGAVKEEFSETYDGAQLERSFTRRIGERSVTSRTLSPTDGKSETKLEVRGLDGDDALSKFEAEWTRSAAGLPKIDPDMDAPTPPELASPDASKAATSTSTRAAAGADDAFAKINAEDAEHADLQGDGVRNFHPEEASAAEAAEGEQSTPTATTMPTSQRKPPSTSATPRSPVKKVAKKGRRVAEAC